MTVIQTFADDIMNCVVVLSFATEWALNVTSLKSKLVGLVQEVPWHTRGHEKLFCSGEKQTRRHNCLALMNFLHWTDSLWNIPAVRARLPRD